MSIFGITIKRTKTERDVQYRLYYIEKELEDIKMSLKIIEGKL